jgi:CRISPR-associated protein Csd1
MILQALVQHYEDLAAKGCVGRPGWGPVKVSFALYIDGQGSLVRVAATQEPQIRGKKNVMVPQTMQLPVPLRHGSKIAANFLCDNVDYILGVDTRENPERTPKCFKASRDLYEEMRYTRKDKE